MPDPPLPLTMKPALVTLMTAYPAALSYSCFEPFTSLNSFWSAASARVRSSAFCFSSFWCCLSCANPGPELKTARTKAPISKLRRNMAKTSSLFGTTGWSRRGRLYIAASRTAPRPARSSQLRHDLPQPGQEMGDGHESGVLLGEHGLERALLERAHVDRGGDIAS